MSRSLAVCLFPFERLRHDVRYAIRGFRREPAVALVAIAILALGIGANTAVFSLVNPLLLRPLPLRDADRLMWIENTGTTGLSGRTYRVDVFEEFQKQTRSFEAMSAYFAFSGYINRTLTGRGDPERVAAVDVAPGFFDVLGVKPERGRLFTSGEHHRGGPRAALLGHGFWRRRFASDPSLVGSTISINGQPVSVVGVLPADFDFASVFTPGTRVDLFVPADLDEMRPWGNTLSIVGRLRPGVTIEAARAEFDAVQTRIRETRKDLAGWGTRAALTTLKEHVSGQMRRSLVVLWAAVGFVLLIVCANLANLVLARTSVRSREFAVRIALGATRGRLVGQLLVEGVMLSLTGALAGIPVAYALTAWVKRRSMLALPLLEYVGVDAAALAVTGALAVITGVLFTLMPALRISARAPQSALQDHSRGAVDARGHAWTRRGLVVAEVAMAAVLLVGAGLLARSFVNLLDAGLGFEPAHAVAARIELPGDVPNDQRIALQREIVHRVSALPGVEAAGLTDALPLDRNRTWVIWVPGRAYTDNKPPFTFLYVVGPGYFQAMGIRLKSGRDFSDADVPGGDPQKPARAVIVNETLARTLYPGVDPVGRPAATGSAALTIVGVVEDVRQTSLDEAPVPQMYLATSQGSGAATDLIVRSALPAASLAPAIRRTLASVDSRLMATDTRVVSDLVERAVSPRRFVVSLLGGFAALALVLAMLGIYGVVSYGVNQRLPEIGVRMALGATAGDVRRQVLGETLWMALAGIAIGAALSFGLAGMLDSLLFGTSATDPATFSAMGVVLTVVALAAGYVPARRASRTDPMRALRAG